MEGFACSEKDCRTRDFLPFLCNVCDGLFCLEHRSRSSHSCCDPSAAATSISGSSTTSKTDTDISVQGVFDAITHRHDTSLLPSTSSGNKAHSPLIKSSLCPITVQGQLTSATISKVDKLQSVKGKATRTRDVNINKATTKILLKSKAMGNKSIPVENRVYLQLTFPASKTRSMMYFSKHSTVAEVLQTVTNTMETAAFGNTFSSGTRGTLVMYSNSSSNQSDETTTAAATTEDGLSSWLNWDMRASLQTYFPDDNKGQNCHSDIEDVCVAAVPMAAVLENQHRFESMTVATKTSTGTGTINNSSKSSGTSAAVTVAPLFNKHQRVLYRKTAEDAPEEAVVHGVHVDGGNGNDDIYYTVFFPRTQQERQTLAARLTAFPEEDCAAGSTDICANAKLQEAGIQAGLGAGMGPGITTEAGAADRRPESGPAGMVVLLRLLHKNQPTEIPLPLPLPLSAVRTSQGSALRTIAQLKAFIAAHPRCGTELAHALSSRTCKLLCQGKMLKDADDIEQKLLLQQQAGSTSAASSTAALTIKIMVIGA